MIFRREFTYGIAGFLLGLLFLSLPQVTSYFLMIQPPVVLIFLALLLSIGFLSFNPIVRTVFSFLFGFILALSLSLLFVGFVGYIPFLYGFLLGALMILVVIYYVKEM
jgi:hypothetical protein